MFQSEVVQLISDIEVFDHFTNEEFDLLSGYFQRIPFAELDIIIKEGDEGSAFYIVMSGKLKVFLPQEIEDGIEKRVSDVKLNVLKEGDCFGEYALIDKRSASASIVAIQCGHGQHGGCNIRMTLVCVPPASVAVLLSQQPATPFVDHLLDP